MSKEEFCHLASFEAFDGMDIINDVAAAFGFHDQSHFHKTFVSAMGINPTTYQQQFFTR